MSVKHTKIKVDLLDFTGACGDDPHYYAARLLAFTKNTRLNMNPEGFERFRTMPLAQLEDEMKYMVRTLPSSWEFVDATFVVRDVSRACAQQITRTRWSPMESDIFGSYAMQAQRVVDVSDVGCYIPESLEGIDRDFYEEAMSVAMGNYKQAVDNGVHNEDARGLLPMHVASNLVVKYNLRALTDLCRKRSSMRVQGEYNEVVRQMRELLIAQWPWSEPFFESKETIASAIIEEVAAKLPREDRLLLAKAADLIKVG
jgi:flavin-dependent thymidylate synthase